MKPAGFDYIRADTAEEVLAALDEHGAEARILAGGQSLVAMLSMRLAKPAVVVDIMRIRELAAITSDKNSIVIPACVRQQAAFTWPSLPATLPLLASALPWVGHFQTRSRGTICG